MNTDNSRTVKIKVFDILKELSKDELKKFSEYLNSPLFNKRKVIRSLLEVYKKYHPCFENPGLTKEKVMKKIFPGKPYNDEVFRNLNSVLFKYAEEFLSFLNYSADEMSVKKHLLEEINHRKVLSIFDRNFEECRKILESSGTKDFGYFYNRFELYLQKDTFNTIINKFSKEDISESEKSFITFFMIKILELQNYILYQCKILGLDKSLFLDEKFIDTIIKKIPAQITGLPQIKIYYNSYKLEQTGNEKYYIELKKLLGSYGNLLKKEELYNKYMDMINYIKTNRSTKVVKTNHELFQLRKEIIERNLMMENTIKNMFFLNLVKSGLKIKEFDWIFDFIKDHQHLLIPKYRESTVNLSLAQFYFEKKDFNRSLSYAAQIKYEDNYYSLQAKNLTARIYFETNELYTLSGFISSYRMYLSKNRTLSEKEISSNNLFLNCLDKLLRISDQKKYYKLKNLISEISSNEFINDQWLLEKAKEMLKKDLQKSHIVNKIES